MLLDTDGKPLGGNALEYAEEHKRFLQEHRPDVWHQLQQDDLNSYLSSVGQQADERYSTMMHQYSNSPEVQKLPYMERVRALQNAHHEAEELVRHDIIYQPLPD